jgi:type IV pilus assembly protein PilO
MINNILIRLAVMTMQRVAVIGVAFAVVYYFTMYNDGSAIETQIQQVQQNIQQEESKAQEAESALKEVERVRAAVGALAEQFRVVSQALPSEVQMADIIRTVDTISRTAGVSVKSKEPQPIVNHDYYEEIPLKISLQGTYSEITMFLYYVTSLERVMRIKSFTIGSPSANNGGVHENPLAPVGHLNFEGEIESFRFIPEKAKASSSETPADGTAPAGGNG